MYFESVKNKLTILLYGLDGGENIEQQFYDNPDNVNLKQDDIDYMLFNSLTYLSFLLIVDLYFECLFFVKYFPYFLLKSQNFQFVH